jgi:hypothetical protein
MNLALWVRNEFGLATEENMALLRDVALKHPDEQHTIYQPKDGPLSNPDTASNLIVKGAWKHLKEKTASMKTTDTSLP